MHLCDHLLPIYMYTNGMTLHVIWHLGAGYGGYIVILILVITRANSLDIPVELQWMWYWIPIISKKTNNFQSNDLDQKKKKKPE